MTYPHRFHKRAWVRACAAAAALPVAMTLAVSAPAVAAESGEVVRVLDVAGVDELEVAAGQTVVFDSGQGRTFSIPESDAPALPAGWSVIRGEDTLRVTASATAAPDEFAVVEVEEATGETDTLRIVVEGTPDEADRALESSSSTWIDRLADRVASFFGA
ncbi:hypothetical protein [Corynebacterium timonense]|uniref:hypothetical protein n=1 Tax=Corynebacterium timonense TaxID=441500 RepID=UPI0012DFDF94|nr:hypothetical protein [Corynebacterium timonense]